MRATLSDPIGRSLIQSKTPSLDVTLAKDSISVYSASPSMGDAEEKQLVALDPSADHAMMEADSEDDIAPEGLPDRSSSLRGDTHQVLSFGEFLQAHLSLLRRRFQFSFNLHETSEAQKAASQVDSMLRRAREIQQSSSPFVNGLIQYCSHVLTSAYVSLYRLMSDTKLLPRRMVSVDRWGSIHDISVDLLNEKEEKALQGKADKASDFFGGSGATGSSSGTSGKHMRSFSGLADDSSGSLGKSKRMSDSTGHLAARTGSDTPSLSAADSAAFDLPTVSMLVTLSTDFLRSPMINDVITVLIADYINESWHRYHEIEQMKESELTEESDKFIRTTIDLMKVSTEPLTRSGIQAMSALTRKKHQTTSELQNTGLRLTVETMDTASSSSSAKGAGASSSSASGLTSAAVSSKINNTAKLSNNACVFEWIQVVLKNGVQILQKQVLKNVYPNVIVQNESDFRALIILLTGHILEEMRKPLGRLTNGIKCVVNSSDSLTTAKTSRSSPALGDSASADDDFMSTVSAPKTSLAKGVRSVSFAAGDFTRSRTGGDHPSTKNSLTAGPSPIKEEEHSVSADEASEPRTSSRSVSRLESFGLATMAKMITRPSSTRSSSMSFTKWGIGSSKHDDSKQSSKSPVPRSPDSSVGPVSSPKRRRSSAPQVHYDPESGDFVTVPEPTSARSQTVRVRGRRKKKEPTGKYSQTVRYGDVSLIGEEVGAQTTPCKDLYSYDGYDFLSITVKTRRVRPGMKMKKRPATLARRTVSESSDSSDAEIGMKSATGGKARGVRLESGFD